MWNLQLEVFLNDSDHEKMSIDILDQVMDFNDFQVLLQRIKLQNTSTTENRQRE